MKTETAYRKLTKRMARLAEQDGDVFLPNPDPKPPIHYFLICMEPSLGRWAGSAREGESIVAQGKRNFVSSYEDFLLHYSVRRFLCGPSQNYHITDLSKGAMLVKKAGKDRTGRYDRWYPLLLEEIELLATPDAQFFAVGKQVYGHLCSQGFDKPLTKIIHYSGQAASARQAAIVGNKAHFARFQKKDYRGRHHKDRHSCSR